MTGKYMGEIWNIIASKENQNLTPRQQQDLITQVLLNMKQEVESNYKTCLKSKIKQAFDNSLELI